MRERHKLLAIREFFSSMNRTELPWCTFCLLSLVCDAASPLHAVLPQKGLRILTTGHSFHVWMLGLLIKLTKISGITGHTQVGRSFIGGWHIIKHFGCKK